MNFESLKNIAYLPKRFPAVLIGIVSATLIFNILIETQLIGETSGDLDQATFMFKLFASVAVSTVAFLAIGLTLERRKNKDTALAVFSYLVSFGFISAVTFWLFREVEYPAESMRRFSYYSLLTNLISVGLFTGPFLMIKVKDSRYWYYVVSLIRSFFIGYIFAALATGALFLLLALTLGLLGIDFSGNFTARISMYLLTLGTLTGTALFLNWIPENFQEHDADVHSQRFLIKLNQIITLPFLSIYSFILILFAIRVIVDETPENTLTPASSAFIGAYLFYAYTMYPLLFEEGNKWFKKSIRVLGIVGIIPLIMFIVGLMIRINEFGITASRFNYVLIWVTAIFAFVQLQLHKKISLKFLPIFNFLFTGIFYSSSIF
ncbi:MAG: DUF4153 domain-containing protein [Candidatus Dojkabacteria bacterium]|nr:DUF4153 domain-containing protein [Candidatus Dojkabacteria bacterium]